MSADLDPDKFAVSSDTSAVGLSHKNMGVGLRHRRGQQGGSADRDQMVAIMSDVLSQLTGPATAQ